MLAVNTIKSSICKYNRVVVSLLDHFHMLELFLKSYHATPTLSNQGNMNYIYIFIYVESISRAFNRICLPEDITCTLILHVHVCTSYTCVTCIHVCVCLYMCFLDVY